VGQQLNVNSNVATLRLPQELFVDLR